MSQQKPIEWDFLDEPQSDEQQQQFQERDDSKLRAKLEYACQQGSTNEPELDAGDLIGFKNQFEIALNNYQRALGKTTSKKYLSKVQVLLLDQEPGASLKKFCDTTLKSVVKCYPGLSMKVKVWPVQKIPKFPRVKFPSFLDYIDCFTYKFVGIAPGKTRVDFHFNIQRTQLL